MKKLIKIAKLNKKSYPELRDYVLFEGSHARSTNLELHYKVQIGGHFAAPCLVPVDLLKSALSLSKVAQWAGDTLNGVVLSGHGHAKFSADSYPTWPIVKDPAPVMFRVKDIPGTIKKMVRAAGVEDIRYYLNGVCFTDEGALVATDGHRMHLQERAFVPLVTGPHIVPRALFDIFPDLDNLELSKDHARANVTDGQVVSKLIDGKFPDYKRVIPEVKARPVQIHVGQDQIDNVRKIAAFVKSKGERFNALKINSDGTIQNATGELTLPFCQPISAEIGVNVAYILNSMEVAGLPCTVNTDTPNDSFLIHGQDADFTAVVMPIRI